MFKSLYAPWRISYILANKIKGCLFCNVIKEKRDKNNLIIERSKYCFVMLNKFPYNNGHIMIVPFKHKSKIEDLNDSTISDMFKMIKKYIVKMKKVMRADAFNIGINIGKFAGAGIADHLHLHIVPRWAGDNNFMPVIGKTKIISESFDSVYKKLKS